MKKIVIFGRNSYIGDAVSAWLQKHREDYQVTVMSSRKPARKEDFSGIDTVFFVAGIARVDAGGKATVHGLDRPGWRKERAGRVSEADYMRVNCDLAIETAALAKAAGVGQFIFMSSITVYGDGKISGGKVICEDTRPAPASFCGKSKLAAEKGLMRLGDERFRVAILRSPMVYGKNSRGNYALLARLACMTPVFPDFPNRRSMIYIGNLCEFVRLMIDNQEAGIFYPQNAAYVNTAQMAACIAKTRGHRLVLTQLLNPLVRLTGLGSSRVKKAFGTLVYDSQMSEYREEYRLFSLEESISLTEGTKDSGKKKVLLLASVASMMEQFNRENIRILQELGYQVHLACNFKTGSTAPEPVIDAFVREMQQKGVRCIQIDFPRGTGRLKQDFLLYCQVRRLLLQEKYRFLHCQSPIGGVIGRLAGHSAKTPVVYTAHGFQFFKGGAIRDWFLFYPAEKLLSLLTDVQITINQGDYLLAKRGLHAKKVMYIPGVGIDWRRFAHNGLKKAECRKLLGIEENAFVLLSVGELCERKNHQAVIRALSLLKEKKMHYYIAGYGEERENLRRLADRLGVGRQVHLVGYRMDLEKWYCAADLSLLPSIREGLGLAGLEAMAAGLPLITTGVGGIGDYAVNKVSGFNCGSRDYEGIASAIRKLYCNDTLRMKMGKRNRQTARLFDKEKVNRRMEKLYDGL